MIQQIIWSKEFLKIKVMVDLCGNYRIVDLSHQGISEMLKEYPKNSDRYNEFKLDLIAAIREDLLGDYNKHWWQFWK